MEWNIKNPIFHYYMVPFLTEAVEASEVAEAAEVNEAKKVSKDWKITNEVFKVIQVLEFNSLRTNITLFWKTFF